MSVTDEPGSRRPTAGVDWATADHAVAIVDPDGEQTGRVGELLIHAAFEQALDYARQAGAGMGDREPVGGRLGSTLTAVSSLLHQWEDTRWSRDTAAGRSLIGARWRTAL